jgi:hypothetical protein
MQPPFSPLCTMRVSLKREMKWMQWDADWLKRRGSGLEVINQRCLTDPQPEVVLLHTSASTTVQTGPLHRNYSAAPLVKKHSCPFLVCSFTPRVKNRLINPVVQSPSWEAYSSLARQEFSRVLPNPKVHYRVHKRPEVDRILSQLNNIIIPSMTRSPKRSPTFRFLD